MNGGGDSDLALLASLRNDGDGGVDGFLLFHHLISSSLL
jgi:hypothetical protein